MTGLSEAITGVVTAVLSLIGTLVWKRHEAAKERRAAADAREEARRRLREIDEARADAKSERDRRIALALENARLLLELDYANRKCDRLSSLIPPEELTGVITGMAPLGDPGQ